MSSAREFRRDRTEILKERPDFLPLELSIAVPFMEISDNELSDLKVMTPEIIFLDLEDDPHIGLKFAQYLSESGELRTLVGVGPEQRRKVDHREQAAAPFGQAQHGVRRAGNPAHRAAGRQSGDTCERQGIALSSECEEQQTLGSRRRAIGCVVCGLHR